MKNSIRMQEFPTIPYLSSSLHYPPVSTYEHTLAKNRSTEERPLFSDEIQKPKRSTGEQKKSHSK